MFFVSGRRFTRSGPHARPVSRTYEGMENIDDAFRALTDDIEISDLAVATILFDEIDKMVDEGYPPELVAKIVREILRGD